ncbi:hypothetical protein Bpfe_017465 [Biomphalaria pfeifferi]|uniref:Uncharacterized protein n=1 Tax=Biomphalaria pfeifferi TaxID=112525 RepID=A0AAD8F743_BIOPF|nr:hypothetical protein Bpfe_017465 [Biomphalaria pfeifferi]
MLLKLSKQRIPALVASLRLSYRSVEVVELLWVLNLVPSMLAYIARKCNTSEISEFLNKNLVMSVCCLQVMDYKD